MPRWQPARIRLHRPLQRRQVEPDQHADRPQRPGHDLGHPRKDHADQPLPRQQKLVHRRPPRLRLCQTRLQGAGTDQEHHRKLHPATSADDLPLRPHRQPSGTAAHRLAIHRMAGRERHPLLHRLHQSRQAEERTAGRQRRGLPQKAERTVGRTPALLRHLFREPTGTERTAGLHRKHQQRT